MNWLLLSFFVALPGACASGGRRDHGPQASKQVTETRSMRPSEDSKIDLGKFSCPPALLAARRGGSVPERHVVPSAIERAAFSLLVKRLTSPDFDRGRAETQAQALGFLIVDVPEIPGTLLLTELPTARRGGGAYLFGRASQSTTVVQAPHTFFDEGTLPLACELFRRSHAAALFIDTAHRFKAAEMDESGAYPADVAHAADSLFQAATEGTLEAFGQRTVVQLHGFGPRESGAAVVLSAGTSSPSSPLPTRSREFLTQIVPGLVARFPDESRELGATTNVQGAVVRRAGGRFLHVEMSAPFRQTLLADANLRARFLDTLASCLELP